MKRDATTLLQRYALVLESFPGGEPLKLADVSHRTGLPRSTTHRLLLDLSGMGWLTRSGGAFELGMPLFELGERVGLKHQLRAAALPFMQDLFAVTEQTVHLAVRDGNDTVYVEKIHGHSSRPLPSRIGGRLPLTCTAVGKALLARETPAVQTQILAEPFRRFTARSIVDPKVLSSELDAIRRTGIAVEREESTDGGCCLASPIVIAGTPVAALSVSVPSDRFEPLLLAPAVRTAALALGRVLRPG